MKRKLRVLLAQLPVPNNPALNTPLAAGYLKAYAAERGLDAAAEIELLPRQLADNAGDALLVDEIVARQPDTLGISLYTWNSERSLEIARRVKARLPQLCVIAGGPEVQKDNAWVLEHPAVDIAVIGEGEQTFAELLLCLIEARRQGDNETSRDDDPDVSLSPDLLVSLSGVAYRDATGALIFTPERAPLSDLSVIPSPYLAGYLEVPEDGMLMVEVSRWCPYSCSFCLYGRNMGARLGDRYFGLERVLAEIRWGRAHGVRRVHFVEANLNLVPLFWPLMRALEDLNADQQMTFYAELRGEHLTDDVVAALDRANVRYVEVGLQTANQTALKASLRRTDLRKWAAGTRRLYERDIEVFLDVILGLPADDEAGIAETLDFIRREDLGPYDVFTLQVLPGTAVRQQARQYGLIHQERPPYYILGTDRLDYGALRRLRRELKLGASLDPDEVEGCPAPQLQIADCGLQIEQDNLQSTIYNLQLVDADTATWAAARDSVRRLARHVEVVARWRDAERLATVMALAIAANPSTLFDCYLIADTPPAPEQLREWRQSLPFQPGYLDRVAVYRAREPAIGYTRVSPRCFLVLPWTATVEPAHFGAIAEVIWRFEIAEGDALPLSAWYGAGGAGIWLHFAPQCTYSYRAEALAAVRQWERETERRVWGTIN